MQKNVPVRDIRHSLPSPLCHASLSKICWEEKKILPNLTRLDKSDKSLRDVFNDVSKYILFISMSLNRLFP